ncbi:MAG: CARDB domain-containing protein, partial [Methanobacteriota archaeon]
MIRPTPLVLLALLLVAGLPPPAAGQASILEAADAFLDDLVRNPPTCATCAVSDPSRFAVPRVERLTSVATAAKDMNVTVFLDDVEQDLGPWREEVLGNDSRDDVDRLWHRETGRGYQSATAWRGAEAATGVYVSGLDRALVSSPIDLRGVVGTSAVAGTGASAYALAAGAARGAYGAVSAHPTFGAVPDDPYAPPAGANLTTPTGLVNLTFVQRYAFQNSTSSLGEYLDGGRVEIRTRGPDGTFTGRPWRVLDPSTVPAASAAAPRFPIEEDLVNRTALPSTARDALQAAEGTLAIHPGIADFIEEVVTLEGVEAPQETASGRTPSEYRGRVAGLGRAYVAESDRHPDEGLVTVRVSDNRSAAGDIDFVADPSDDIILPEGPLIPRRVPIGPTGATVNFDEGDDVVRWVNATFDLTDHAGEVVEIRFRLRSDAFRRESPEGWTIDDVKVGGLAFRNDVGVEGIESPRDGDQVPPGFALPVVATVKNYGVDPQSRVVAALRVNGTVVDTVTLPRLASQERVRVTFRPWVAVPTETPVAVNVTTSILPDAAADPLAGRPNGTVDMNPRNDANDVPVAIRVRTVRDLVIDRPVVEPAVGDVLEPRNVTVSIRNRGNVDETVRIGLVARRVDRDTGAVLATSTVAPLSLPRTVPAGKDVFSGGGATNTTNVSFVWDPNASGVYDVVASIENEGALLEAASRAFARLVSPPYLLEDFETPRGLSSAIYVGRSGAWSVGKVPEVPEVAVSPFSGNHSWTATTADGLPEFTGTTRYVPICSFTAWTDVPEAACDDETANATKRLVNCVESGNENLTTRKPSSSGAEPAQENACFLTGGKIPVGIGATKFLLNFLAENVRGGRTHYVLSRTVDLGGPAANDAELRFASLSFMNWDEFVNRTRVDGDDPERAARVQAATEAFVADLQAATADGTVD